MTPPPHPPPSGQVIDRLYAEIQRSFGSALARFALGYERDPARRRELLQDVHVAIWRSLARFDGRCSLRTWAYRVAHNIGANHVQDSVRRPDRRWEPLDDAHGIADDRQDGEALERGVDLQRVLALVRAMPAPDRQLMLLYLEDLDAASIGEVVG